MTKVIYIASGDGHCGSTLLDMLLSGHTKVCGLGEVQMLLADDTRTRYLARDYHDRICSCGDPIDTCPVWSRVTAFIDNSLEAQLGKRYSVLRQCVQEHRGSDTILCDSSKYLAQLDKFMRAVEGNAVPGVEKADVFVVHLLKDIRSSMTSRKRRDGLSWFRPVRLLRAYYGWCYSNWKLRRYLEDTAIRHAVVNYDALCLNTEYVLRELCKAIGIEFESHMLNLERSRGHIGLGNPMRTHDVKSRRVVYDARWFYENDIHAAYLLLPGIRRLNQRLNGVERQAARPSQLFEPNR